MLLSARGSWLFVKGSFEPRQSALTEESGSDQNETNEKPVKNEQEARSDKRVTA